MMSGRTSLESETWAVGSPVGELLADPPFVRGAVVGVEERHGDRLHRPVGEDADHLAHLALVERPPDRPVRRDALVDLERELAGNEGLGLPLEPVVEVGPILTTELEHVAEAARREERRLRPAALEERVRAHGGSVQERRDLAAHRGECLENADARVAGRRRDLRRPDNGAVGAGGDEVRERAARVDPDREAAGHGPPRSVATASSSSATWATDQSSASRITATAPAASRCSTQVKNRRSRCSGP